MSDLDKARETQLKNIQSKTGKSLEDVRLLIQQSGLSKHGEIRTLLMNELGLGYGDANSLVHYALQSDGQSAAEAASATLDDVLGEIYSGGKAPLLPIHQRVMAAVEGFGLFESVPKKGYVSLRRKKQFAMVGPATKSQVEVGLNAKELPAGGRLVEVPPGGMCQYKVRLSSPDEVDGELIEWIRQAYDTAG